MPIISANLYKALKKAGVEEDLAEKASVEVAESTKLVLEQKNDITEIKSEINSLKQEIRIKFNILITVNVAVLGAFIATLMAFVFLK